VTPEAEFWRRLDGLVAERPVRIDRPRGSAHPRYPDFIYPLDYGYLDGTRAPDGAGLDVWVGRLAERRVTAVVCAVDAGKRDVELKLLIGCAPDEAARILSLHNDGDQAALLIPRPAGV
jgi:inorganic pyrophosphatase